MSNSQRVVEDARAVPNAADRFGASVLARRRVTRSTPIMGYDCITTVSTGAGSSNSSCLVCGHTRLV